MIFEDRANNRWKKTILAVSLVATIALLILVIWIGSIMTHPSLPSLRVENQRKEWGHETGQEIRNAELTAIPEKSQKKERSVRIQTNREPLPAAGSIDLHEFLKKRGKDEATTENVPLIAGGSGSDAHRMSKRNALSTAFLVQDDEDSIRSFQEHADSIDIVFPDWYFVNEPKCHIGTRENLETTAVLHSNHAAIMPRITNADSAGIWHSEALLSIFSNDEKRKCLIGALANLLKDAHVDGVNIDFEELEADARDPFLDFLVELRAALHAQGQVLTVDIPVRDPAFDVEFIGSVADAVIVMAYDEHYAAGSAGPIASHEWFDESVDELLQSLPSEKIIISMGSYGYDWPVGNPPKRAESLKFSQIMSLAHEVEAEPEMEAASRNMFFGYEGADGVRHHVWFLNGTTLWNQWHSLRNKNILGSSIWRLGSEDPGVWSVIDNPGASADVLIRAKELSTIEYDSQGELFKLREKAQRGEMEITYDDEGFIDSAHYITVPTGYVVERVGKGISPKDLILTFDDGPDEIWTPGIMDILSRYHVPAVFFVLGDQAQRYPLLLERMDKEGFLIGNHTYFHPNIQSISNERLKLELNSTQRIIESACGRKTILFRAPYDTDTSPSTIEQFGTISQIIDLGYIILGANVDSFDWKQPGVDNIIENVKQQIADPSSHVIVMHDGGGDRSQTLAALEKMIPELREKGYRFVGLDEAVGIDRHTLLAPLEEGERVFVAVTKVISWIRHWGWSLIIVLFYITTGISIFRILFLGSIVVRTWKRKERVDRGGAADAVFVSVLIPALNEQETIGKTIRAIQASTHTNYEVIVIDDGSTDQTTRVAGELAKEDERVRVISKANGGKSSALNVGFQAARADIVVTVDADTLLYPFTLTKLIEPFSDATVDAVCGNVEVGNVRNVLTAFQALEYVTTQNFDRRAFEELNCISVVPGATGAWRRRKVLEIGGYADDILTEDADLTLRLLRSGGKIVYAGNARSQTEAPETLRTLIKQRFRWSFGTFQCLYKHRRAFFDGTLGWVALPNMFLFQVIFPALSPIGDLVFLLSIIRGDLGAILVGYILFLVMDLGGSVLAFHIEKRPKHLIWLILIQRFFYRQFMYVVTYISIGAVFRGRRYGWNKLKRTGNIDPTVICKSNLIEIGDRP